jgi:anti-sigma B factor antagonist
VSHDPRREPASDRTQLLSVTALPWARPGHAVVEVTGEIDTYTAPLLDACLTTQTRRRGVRQLTVDMERVTFLGAAGVSALARAQRRCGIRGVRLVLVCNGRRRVLRPTQLCGLDDVLPTRPEDPREPESRTARTGSPSRAGARRTGTRRRRELCR